MLISPFLSFLKRSVITARSSEPWANRDISFAYSYKISSRIVFTKGGGMIEVYQNSKKAQLQHFFIHFVP